jgi:selenocysteine lyase/cysteine desulfurase
MNLDGTRPLAAREGAFAERDIAALRAETPGAEHHVHLNNAGSSLMPEPVARAVKDHLAWETMVGGYQAESDRKPALANAHESVAGLVGARPDQIAFTQSATMSFAGALSSIPFEAGDVILTTRNDYVSNQLQFLSLQRRHGIRVIRAPDESSGGVDVDAMRALVHRLRPRLVAVTHVPTNSGLVQDVAGIGAACRATGTWYLVDACQSAGQMPLMVDAVGCDFLVGTFRKYLRGPRGVGFVYVSDRVTDTGLHPLFPDYQGAEWISADEFRVAPGAMRFATFEYSPALVLGAGAAADYALRLGIERINARIHMLAERLRDGLARLPAVHLLDRGRRLCGMVSMSLSHMDAPDVAAKLRRDGIHASAQSRRVAVIDYDDKGITSSLRLSPHYFNTEAEVDRVIQALERMSPPPGS